MTNDKKKPNPKRLRIEKVVDTEQATLEEFVPQFVQGVFRDLGGLDLPSLETPESAAEAVKALESRLEDIRSAQSRIRAMRLELLNKKQRIEGGS